MWKFISLSVILIVAQAADVKDLYDIDWVLAAYYPEPNGTLPRHCTKHRFSKYPEDAQCTFSDGSRAISLQAEIMNANGSFWYSVTTIATVVEDFAQVMPALNLTAKCHEKEHMFFSVVRFVQEDYVIIYQIVKVRDELLQVQAGLFAKHIVSQKKLNEIMATIEVYKQRRGIVQCTTEIYDGLNIL
ncbi:hypothetical protein B5X24_HaOG203347 [Helicoverpa armigera]|nr:hypothetical protein B5X24_HaOG203347 [Helicoverpa armigera]